MNTYVPSDEAQTSNQTALGNSSKPAASGNTRTFKPVHVAAQLTNNTTGANAAPAAKFSRTGGNAGRLFGASAPLTNSYKAVQETANQLVSANAFAANTNADNKRSISFANTSISNNSTNTSAEADNIMQEDPAIMTALAINASAIKAGSAFTSVPKVWQKPNRETTTRTEFKGIAAGSNKNTKKMPAQSTYTKLTKGASKSAPGAEFTDARSQEQSNDSEGFTPVRNRSSTRNKNKEAKKASKKTTSVSFSDPMEVQLRRNRIPEYALEAAAVFDLPIERIDYNNVITYMLERVEARNKRSFNARKDYDSVTFKMVVAQKKLARYFNSDDKLAEEPAYSWYYKPKEPKPAPVEPELKKATATTLGDALKAASTPQKEQKTRRAKTANTATLVAEQKLQQPSPPVQRNKNISIARNATATVARQGGNSSSTDMLPTSITPTMVTWDGVDIPAGYDPVAASHQITTLESMNHSPFNLTDQIKVAKDILLAHQAYVYYKNKANQKATSAKATKEETLDTAKSPAALEQRVKRQSKRSSGEAGKNSLENSTTEITAQELGGEQPATKSQKLAMTRPAGTTTPPYPNFGRAPGPCDLLPGCEPPAELDSKQLARFYKLSAAQCPMVYSNKKLYKNPDYLTYNEFVARKLSEKMSSSSDDEDNITSGESASSVGHRVPTPPPAMLASPDHTSEEIVCSKLASFITDDYLVYCAKRCVGFTLDQFEQRYGLTSDPAILVNFEMTKEALDQRGVRSDVFELVYDRALELHKHLDDEHRGRDFAIDNISSTSESVVASALSESTTTSNWTLATAGADEEVAAITSNTPERAPLVHPPYAFHNNMEKYDVSFFANGKYVGYGKYGAQTTTCANFTEMKQFIGGLKVFLEEEPAPLVRHIEKMLTEVLDLENPHLMISSAKLYYDAGIAGAYPFVCKVERLNYAYTIHFCGVEMHIEHAISSDHHMAVSCEALVDFIDRTIGYNVANFNMGSIDWKVITPDSLGQNKDNTSEEFQPTAKQTVVLDQVQHAEEVDTSEDFNPDPEQLLEKDEAAEEEAGLPESATHANMPNNIQIGEDAVEASGPELTHMELAHQDVEETTRPSTPTPPCETQAEEEEEALADAIPTTPSVDPPPASAEQQELESSKYTTPRSYAGALLSVPRPLSPMSEGSQDDADVDMKDTTLTHTHLQNNEDSCSVISVTPPPLVIDLQEDAESQGEDMGSDVSTGVTSPTLKARDTDDEHLSGTESLTPGSVVQKVTTVEHTATSDIKRSVVATGLQKHLEDLDIAKICDLPTIEDISTRMDAFIKNATAPELVYKFELQTVDGTKFGVFMCKRVKPQKKSYLSWSRPTAHFDLGFTIVETTIKFYGAPGVVLEVQGNCRNLAHDKAADLQLLDKSIIIGYPWVESQTRQLLAKLQNISEKLTEDTESQLDSDTEVTHNVDTSISHDDFIAEITKIASEQNVVKNSFIAFGSSLFKDSQLIAAIQCSKECKQNVQALLATLENACLTSIEILDEHERVLDSELASEQWSIIDSYCDTLPSKIESAYQTTVDNLTKSHTAALAYVNSTCFTDDSVFESLNTALNTRLTALTNMRDQMVSKGLEVAASYLQQLQETQSVIARAEGIIRDIRVAQEAEALKQAESIKQAQAAARAEAERMSTESAARDAVVAEASRLKANLTRKRVAEQKRQHEAAMAAQAMNESLLVGTQENVIEFGEVDSASQVNSEPIQSEYDKYRVETLEKSKSLLYRIELRAYISKLNNTLKLHSNQVTERFAKFLNHCMDTVPVGTTSIHAVKDTCSGVIRFSVASAKKLESDTIAFVFCSEKIIPKSKHDKVSDQFVETMCNRIKQRLLEKANQQNLTGSINPKQWYELAHDEDAVFEPTSFELYHHSAKLKFGNPCPTHIQCNARTIDIFLRDCMNYHASIAQLDVNKFNIRNVVSNFLSNKPIMFNNISWSYEKTLLESLIKDITDLYNRGTETGFATSSTLANMPCSSGHLFSQYYTYMEPGSGHNRSIVVRINNWKLTEREDTARNNAALFLYRECINYCTSRITKLVFNEEYGNSECMFPLGDEIICICSTNPALNMLLKPFEPNSFYLPQGVITDTPKYEHLGLLGNGSKDKCRVKHVHSYMPAKKYIEKYLTVKTYSESVKIPIGGIEEYEARECTSLRPHVKVLLERAKQAADDKFHNRVYRTKFCGASTDFTVYPLEQVTSYMWLTKENDWYLQHHVISATCATTVDCRGTCKKNTKILNVVLNYTNCIQAKKLQTEFRVNGSVNNMSRAEVCITEIQEHNIAGQRDEFVNFDDDHNPDDMDAEDPPESDSDSSVVELTSTPISTSGNSSTIQASFRDFRTLAEFGYRISDGRIVDANGNPFSFVVDNLPSTLREERYELFFSIFIEHFWRILRTDFRMTKAGFPGSSGYCLSTPNVFDKAHIMVILHGSGSRAGIWSRKYTYSHGISVGTQYNYIRRAVEMGFGVILADGYNNKTLDDKAIVGCSTYCEHLCTIMKTYCNTAKTISFVAHSAGGVALLKALKELPQRDVARISSIYLTDSVHWNQNVHDLPEHAQNMFFAKAENFVTSDEPLGTTLSGLEMKFSAGTTTHELTSHTSIDTIFSRLLDVYRPYIVGGVLSDTVVAEARPQTNEVTNADVPPFNPHDPQLEAHEVDTPSQQDMPQTPPNPAPIAAGAGGEPNDPHNNTPPPLETGEGRVLRGSTYNFDADRRDPAPPRGCTEPELPNEGLLDSIDADFKIYIYAMGECIQHLTSRAAHIQITRVNGSFVDSLRDDSNTFLTAAAAREYKRQYRSDAHNFVEFVKPGSQLTPTELSITAFTILHNKGHGDLGFITLLSKLSYGGRCRLLSGVVYNGAMRDCCIDALYYHDRPQERGLSYAFSETDDPILTEVPGADMPRAKRAYWTQKILPALMDLGAPVNVEFPVIDANEIFATNPENAHQFLSTSTHTPKNIFQANGRFYDAVDAHFESLNIVNFFTKFNIRSEHDIDNAPSFLKTALMRSGDTLEVKHRCKGPIFHACDIEEIETSLFAGIRTHGEYLARTAGGFIQMLLGLFVTFCKIVTAGGVAVLLAILGGFKYITANGVGSTAKLAAGAVHTLVGTPELDVEALVTTFRAGNSLQGALHEYGLGAIIWMLTCNVGAYFAFFLAAGTGISFMVADAVGETPVVLGCIVGALAGSATPFVDGIWHILTVVYSVKFTAVLSLTIGVALLITALASRTSDAKRLGSKKSWCALIGSWIIFSFAAIYLAPCNGLWSIHLVTPGQSVSINVRDAVLTDEQIAELAKHLKENNIAVPRGLEDNTNKTEISFDTCFKIMKGNVTAFDCNYTDLDLMHSNTYYNGVYYNGVCTIALKTAKFYTIVPQSKRMCTSIVEGHKAALQRVANEFAENIGQGHQAVIDSLEEAIVGHNTDHITIKSGPAIPEPLKDYITIENTASNTALWSYNETAADEDWKLLSTEIPMGAHVRNVANGVVVNKRKPIWNYISGNIHVDSNGTYAFPLGFVTSYDLPLDQTRGDVFYENGALYAKGYVGKPLLNFIPFMAILTFILGFVSMGLSRQTFMQTCSFYIMGSCISIFAQTTGDWRLQVVDTLFVRSAMHLFESMFSSFTALFLGATVYQAYQYKNGMRSVDFILPSVCLAVSSLSAFLSASTTFYIMTATVFMLYKYVSSAPWVAGGNWSSRESLQNWVTRCEESVGYVDDVYLARCKKFLRNVGDNYTGQAIRIPASDDTSFKAVASFFQTTFASPFIVIQNEAATRVFQRAILPKPVMQIQDYMCLQEGVNDKGATQYVYSANINGCTYYPRHVHAVGSPEYCAASSGMVVKSCSDSYNEIPFKLPNSNVTGYLIRPEVVIRCAISPTGVHSASTAPGDCGSIVVYKEEDVNGRSQWYIAGFHNLGFKHSSGLSYNAYSDQYGNLPQTTYPIDEMTPSTLSSLRVPINYNILLSITYDSCNTDFASFRGSEASPDALSKTGIYFDDLAATKAYQSTFGSKRPNAALAAMKKQLTAIVASPSWLISVLAPHMEPIEYVTINEALVADAASCTTGFLGNVIYSIFAAILSGSNLVIDILDVQLQRHFGYIENSRDIVTSFIQMVALIQMLYLTHSYYIKYCKSKQAQNYLANKTTAGMPKPSDQGSTISKAALRLRKLHEYKNRGIEIIDAALSLECLVLETYAEHKPEDIPCDQWMRQFTNYVVTLQRFCKYARIKNVDFAALDDKYTCGEKLDLLTSYFLDVIEIMKTDDLSFLDASVSTVANESSSSDSPIFNDFIRIVKMENMGEAPVDLVKAICAEIPDPKEGCEAVLLALTTTYCDYPTEFIFNIITAVKLYYGNSSGINSQAQSLDQYYSTIKQKKKAENRQAADQLKKAADARKQEKIMAKQSAMQNAEQNAALQKVKQRDLIIAALTRMAEGLKGFKQISSASQRRVRQPQPIENYSLILEKVAETESFKTDMKVKLKVNAKEIKLAQIVLASTTRSEHLADEIVPGWYVNAYLPADLRSAVLQHLEPKTSSVVTESNRGGADVKEGTPLSGFVSTANLTELVDLRIKAAAEVKKNTPVRPKQSLETGHSNARGLKNFNASLTGFESDRTTTSISQPPHFKAKQVLESKEVQLLMTKLSKALDDCDSSNLSFLEEDGSPY